MTDTTTTIPPRRNRSLTQEEIDAWDRAIRERMAQDMTWVEIARDLQIHTTTLARWRLRLGLE